MTACDQVVQATQEKKVLGGGGEGAREVRTGSVKDPSGVGI